MARGISTPALEINNNTLAIVPNTLLYTEGFGEDTVSVASAGGGSSELITFENAEMFKGKVNFEVFTTKRNIDFLRAIKAQPGSNVVSFTDDRTGFARTITNATIINDYEVNLSSEGKIAIEIEGSRPI